MHVEQAHFGQVTASEGPCFHRRRLCGKFTNINYIYDSEGARGSEWLAARGTAGSMKSACMGWARTDGNRRSQCPVRVSMYHLDPYIMPEPKFLENRCLQVHPLG